MGPKGRSWPKKKQQRPAEKQLHPAEKRTAPCRKSPAWKTAEIFNSRELLKKTTACCPC
jgi:hypothetical protein